jgi:ssDNA-binding Zn-finger/Zn-ribbon topoisomerase 1
MDAVRAEPSDVTCPKCSKPMVYRWAKNGRFLACSGYPECKQSFNVDAEGRPVVPKESDQACPACGKPMVMRRSRLGYFLGCSAYPECDKAIPCDAEGNAYKLVKEEELTDKCDACGSEMRVKRFRGRTFLACSGYPNCKQTQPIPEGVYIEKKPAPPAEEAGVKCEKCGRAMVIRTGSRGKFIACPGFPKCRNTHPIDKLAALQASQPVVAGEAADHGSSNGSSKAPKPAPKKAAKRAAAAETPGERNGQPPPGFAFTRTGRYVVETWPEGPLICPECGSEMQLKQGRWGAFYSCSNFPSCRVSANLRGEAKKRAEVESPAPSRPKPIPTDIECEECGSKMVIRTGRTGQFLGCSNYPKCKATRPVPSELIGSTANGS